MRTASLWQYLRRHGLHVAGFALVCLAVACGGGSSDSAGGVGAAPAAAVCPNADLSALTKAVYVSAQGTDTDGCGQTTASACKTIQRGIDSCDFGGGCAVLVRHGHYQPAATIALAGAVSVYGSCLFDGEPNALYWSVIEAPPDGAPALSAVAINSPTTVHGLFVVGSDATTPGRASVAMTVSSSLALTLSHNQLVSGRGADGAAGATTDGATGNAGSLTADYLVGGLGGASCAASGAGGGGQGADLHTRVVSNCFVHCDCTIPKGNSPPAGRSGVDSGSVPGGAGATSQGTIGCACNSDHTPGDGPPGQDGSPGACGASGGVADLNTWGVGALEAAWQPGAGGTGTPGDVGSGGGGGGAGGFSATRSNNDTHPGQPGGGGGAGGCGGPGGTGGQQGGASIPLLLVQSSVARVATVLIPGVGGNGGDGGAGGRGGAGGVGGAGGPGHNLELTVSAVCTKIKVPGGGGVGGPGGQGGAGAGGAGGNGGPAFGLLASGLPAGVAPSTDNLRVYRGLPGAGGQGAPGGQNDNRQCEGTQGTGGLPGGSAALSGNLMLSGETLGIGQARASSNGFVLTLQGDGNLVLSWNGVPSWGAGTQGRGVQTATMQADGNLCLADASGNLYWCSQTSRPGSHLLVQEDGNVVIYDGSTAVRTLNTAGAQP